MLKEFSVEFEVKPVEGVRNLLEGWTGDVEAMVKEFGQGLLGGKDKFAGVLPFGFGRRFSKDCFEIFGCFGLVTAVATSLLNKSIPFYTIAPT